MTSLFCFTLRLINSSSTLALFDFSQSSRPACPTVFTGWILLGTRLLDCWLPLPAAALSRWKFSERRSLGSCAYGLNVTAPPHFNQLLVILSSVTHPVGHDLCHQP